MKKIVLLSIGLLSLTPVFAGEGDRQNGGEGGSNGQVPVSSLSSDQLKALFEKDGAMVLKPGADGKVHIPKGARVVYNPEALLYIGKQPFNVPPSFASEAKKEEKSEASGEE